MDIKFENIDKTCGKLSVRIEAADYAEGLEKTLKEFRRKAQVKGFRPGCVPMGMVRKLYGPEAKADEVLKALNRGVEGYLRENKIKVLGRVMPADESPTDQDYKNGDTFDFVMDVAIEPEVSVELGKDDKISYYDIQVGDKYVDGRVEELRMAHGAFEQVDDYQTGDYMKGDLVEVASAEGAEPLKVEGVVVSPEYVKDAEQKKLFDGARKGDVLTLKPASLYNDEVQAAAMLKIKKEELANHSGEFTYAITEINRRKPAELDQEFFDAVLGKDKADSEESFREKMREEYSRAQAGNSDYKFYEDLRAYALSKQGGMEISEPMLKRMMRENNPDRDEKYIDDNYAAALEQLKWQLVRDHLAAAVGIKVEENDIRDMARVRTRRQFAAYGMQLPDELVEKYAEKSLKEERQLEELYHEVLSGKLIAEYKERVTLDRKQVSLEEFEKMMGE